MLTLVLAAVLAANEKPAADLIKAVAKEAAAKATEEQKERTDWTTLGAVITGVLGAVSAGVAGALKLLFSHLKTREEKAQAHAREMMDEVKGIATKFDATTREQASLARQDSQNTVKLLMDVQSRTVEAVGTLSQEVHSLGMAIGELRGEVARKADRDPAPPMGPPPRPERRGGRHDQ